MKDDRTSIISRELRSMWNDVIKLQDMIISCKVVLPTSKYEKIMNEFDRILIHQLKVSKRVRYKHNVLLRNISKMAEKIEETKSYI